jgi:predicted nuclease with TOPRIM domain
VEVHKEYRNYKFKVVTKYVFITGGIALNISVNAITIATAGFHFGAGTVISIIGLARSTIALARLTADCFRDVDSAIKDALEVYLSISKNENKKLSTGRHLTAALINAFTEELTSLPAFFDTLPKATEKLKLAQNKFLGTEVALYALSTKIAKVNQKIDRLKARLEVLKNTPAFEQIPKRTRFDPAKLAASEKRLEKLQAEYEVADTAFKMRRNILNDLSKNLAELEKEHKWTPRAAKAFGLILKVVDTAVGLAVVDFTSVADVAAETLALGFEGAEFVGSKVIKAIEKREIDIVKGKMAKVKVTKATV